MDIQVQDAPQVISEAERVCAWRIGQASRLGYTDTEAVKLAEMIGPDGWPVDLHKLARMIAQGCPRTLAVEILA